MVKMTLRIGKKSTASGFTLLETIIVLGIMTMFFVISIPFFSRFTENTKLETSTRSVVSALRTARGYAITNNVDYYLVFDLAVTPNMYFISADTTTAVEKKERLPIGISLSTTGNPVRFKATGEAVNDISITLTQQDSANTKIITVERTTGRARIE